MRLVWSSCIGLLAVITGGTAMVAEEISSRTSVAAATHFPTGPMTFQIGRRAASPACGLECAEFIYAEGDIKRDTVHSLLVLLSRLKRPLPIYLHSPGGSLEGGLDLGNALRRAGVPVVVARMQPLSCAPNGPCTEADTRAGITVFADKTDPGLCNSACVYSFAGGIQRHVPAGSTLGIHQFFVARADDKGRKPLPSYTREDFSHLQKTVATVAAYLADKNVSVEVLSLAADVDPSTIRSLSERELSTLKLATGTSTPFAQQAAFVRLPSLSPPATPPGQPPVPQPKIAVLSAPPPSAGGWPVVERGGQPFAVLAIPSQSRRFGEIGYEVAIGCGGDPGRYMASFREIIPSRPGMLQDATVLVGPPQRTEKLAPYGPISRETALAAERNGVLEMEVTSSSTAGYPMKLEFPGNGLKSALDTLDQACKRR